MKRKNSKNAFALDTFALLAYYNNEPGVDIVKDLLKKAQQGKVSLFLSEINIGEIYYTVAREQDQTKADLLLENLLKLTIHLVQANLERILSAASYKSRGGLSYADCFVLATAEEFNTSIITGDPEFKKIEKDFNIVWLYEQS